MDDPPPPPSDRLRDLFDRALALPAADRDAFLAAACGDDAAALSAIRGLLSAHERAGPFLADPSAAAVDPLLRGDARIGPYRIVRRVGQGGHGTVYLAEQDQPLRRPVAVKVIRAGADTRQTVARFELERQALARMDHPNIAEVYDAGATPDGRPYVVMEWVDGRPITDHCRGHGLVVRDRLAVFRDACAAAQHAHQKGIVHRDFKPSNVLVAERAGRPVVKVIDFGIAKLVGESAAGADDVGLTEHRQWLGTPQYMSPEQVGDDRRDLDTRADVYGLGAILYELLTDRPPFDPQALRSATLAEVRRTIMEVDPPRPSGRAGAGGRVRRELDWVVLKAMSKDRARRYPTADALSADLLRFLRDEPVEAGPLSAWYRTAKFASRHRRWVATGVVVAGTIGVAVAATAAGAARARRERDRAVAAEAREAALRRTAEAEAARAFSAQQFVYELVATAGDTTPPLPPPMLDELARRADDGLFASHPDVLSTLRLALGMAYQRADRTDAAIRQFQAFLALRPADAADDVNAAAALHNLGAAMLAKGDYAGSRPLFQRAMEMSRRLHGGQDSRDDVRMVEMLGLTTANAGDLDAAEPLLRRAIELYRQYDGPSHKREAYAMEELAQVRKGKGDHADSARLWAAARQILGPTTRPRRGPATAAAAGAHNPHR